MVLRFKIFIQKKWTGQWHNTEVTSSACYFHLTVRLATKIKELHAGQEILCITYL